MLVLRVVHTIRLGLWYTYHVISLEPSLTFKGWRNHIIEGLTHDLVDMTLIHKLMVGVYGGVNGHRLVPLMPSRLVKTLGKWLGIHCICIMVLGLWCSEASAHLEDGADPIDLQVSLSQLCVTCVYFFGFLYGTVMLLMPSCSVYRWMWRHYGVCIGCTCWFGISSSHSRVSLLGSFLSSSHFGIP